MNGEFSIGLLPRPGEAGGLAVVFGDYGYSLSAASLVPLLANQLLLFEVDDQELVAGKLDKIVAGLQQAGAPIETEEVTIAGLSVTMIYIDGVPISPLGYLFIGDFLVIGWEDDLLWAINAYNYPTESLAQSDEYQTMSSYLPENKSGLAYINIYKAVNSVLRRLPAQEREDYQEIAPFVDPLRWLVISTFMDEDAITASIVLHVRAEGVTTGTVEGWVLLQGRQGHSGTRVRIWKLAAITDEQGRFAISDIPPGTHTITASRPGFLDSQKTNVEVKAERLPLLLDATVLFAGNPVPDQAIDIQDLAAVAASFNTKPLTNPDADFNGDEIIDIFDLVLVGKNFGKQGPTPWSSSDCVVCHSVGGSGVGQAGGLGMPADHQGRTSGTCLACH